MPTLIKTIRCPICGKSSALPSASFRKTKVENLGEVIVQECRGRHGFKKIKASPLIDEMKDPRMKYLLDELGDSASCIIVTIMEQGLDLDTRGIIDMYHKLEQKYRDTVDDMRDEADEISSEADDLGRKVVSLQEQLASYLSELNELHSKSDDDDRKINALNEKISEYVNKIKLAYSELDELRSMSDDFNKLQEKWNNERMMYKESLKKLSDENDYFRSVLDDSARATAKVGGSDSDEWDVKEKAYKEKIRQLEQTIRIKESQLQRYDVDALDFNK